MHARGDRGNGTLLRRVGLNRVGLTGKGGERRVGRVGDGERRLAKTWSGKQVRIYLKTKYSHTQETEVYP